MKRSRALIALAVALAALALILAACGGDDAETTTDAAPSDAPNAGATPPSDPGALPPEFVECMADRGYDIESSADIHSAPPEVLQACFGGAHQGGG